jgi:hypothetical protein
LTDVRESITSGRTISFLITECNGRDVEINGRRGRLVERCRPRIFLGVDLSEEEMRAGNTCFEIKEPVGQLDKNCVRLTSPPFSLHEFYILNPGLCQSALSSLKEKIAVISEHSRALLEAQLGDELIKLVTARLAGGDVEDASLKKLLTHQIESRMNECVGAPIREVAKGNMIQHLELVDGDLAWAYKMSDYPRFEITLTWKHVAFRWDETAKKGNLACSFDILSVRNALLFLVNLESFGQMVVWRLAKIME